MHNNLTDNNIVKRMFPVFDVIKSLFDVLRENIVKYNEGKYGMMNFVM